MASFELAPSGLWVPQQPLQKIVVYVDETYLHRDTATIYAAVVMPESGERAIDDAITGLPSRFRSSRVKSFKAQNLDERNSAVYQEFLRFVANTIGQVGSETALRSIVTLHGRDAIHDSNFDYVVEHLGKTACTNGIESKEFLHELARLALWLLNVFPKICPQEIANEFCVILDSKHRYAQYMCEVRFTHDPQYGHQLFKVERIATILLNSFFDAFRQRKWIPRISCVKWETDQKYRGLQAADLLANLFYNALCVEAGASWPKALLKRSIFLSKVSNSFPDDVKSAVTLEDTALVCTNPNLRMHCLIGPA